MPQPATIVTSFFEPGERYPSSSEEGSPFIRSDGETPHAGSCSEGNNGNGPPRWVDESTEAWRCRVYTFIAKSINDYFLKVLPMLMGAHYLGDWKFFMALFAMLTTATNTTDTRLKDATLKIMAKPVGIASCLCGESLDLLYDWRILEASIGWLQSFCGLTLVIFIPGSVCAGIASAISKMDGKVPKDFQKGFWYLYAMLASLQLAILLFIWLPFRSNEAEKCLEAYRAIGSDLCMPSNRAQGVLVLALEAEGFFSTFVGASFVWTVDWTLLLSGGASLNSQQLSGEDHGYVRILSTVFAGLAVASLAINNISSIRALVVGGDRHRGENDPSFRNLGRKVPLALFDCTVYAISMHVMLGTFYHRYITQHPSNPGDPVDDPIWNGFLIFLNCLAVMRHAAFNWRPGTRPGVVRNRVVEEVGVDRRDHQSWGACLRGGFMRLFSAPSLPRRDDPSLEGTPMQSLLAQGGSDHDNGYQPLPGSAGQLDGLPVVEVRGLAEAVC